MRTTVTLEDALYEQALDLACSTRLSRTGLAGCGLRRLLAAEAPLPAYPRWGEEEEVGRR